MNTRRFSRWFWPVLAALFLSTPLFPNNAASQPQGGANANVKTVGGLMVATFPLKPGTITVNLPDDILAGDTISGIVTSEPKGGTEDERNKNRGVLEGFVIEVGGANFPVSKGKVGPIVIPGGTVGRPPGIGMPPLQLSFFDVFVEVQPGGKPVGQAKIPLLPSGAVITPDPKITTPPGMTPSGAVITPDPKVTTPPGMTPSGAVITPDPKVTTPPGMTTSGAVITPDPKITPTFIIPPLEQTGRPIVITGPFDGKSSNTQLNWTRPRSTVQDFEKNTENVSGGFGLLAESPRKAVFRAPTNVTGPIEINLKEGNQETRGTYRNVGVNLTAPRTSLKKGESTELHVEVQGLQGITQPVPLQLTNGGAVTMQGGNTQTMSIKPSDVQSNGTFTTTRTITGVQTGVWNATATVVVFDFCLQDEKSGNLLQFNSTTGDYHFCNLFPTLVAGESGRINISWYGTTTPDTGSVGWSGCTITLQHNSTDGRVKAQVDRCTQTGSATIQPASSKTTFKITDRDTSNNTCVCK